MLLHIGGESTNLRNTCTDTGKVQVWIRYGDTEIFEKVGHGYGVDTYIN